MKTRVWFGLATALVLLGAGREAAADSISIQFSGLDLDYDGSLLSDAGSPFGGIGDPADSDPLIGATYLRDGVPVGSQNSDLFADLGFGLAGIPVAGGVVSNNFFDFFDLLTVGSQPGFGLGLDFDPGSFTIFFDATSSTILGSGVASGVVSQSLPFGLTLDEDESIVLSFSTQILTSTNDGTFLTSFTSRGTGEITGIAAVPEPASALTLGIGLAAGAVLLRVRHVVDRRSTVAA